MKLELGHRAQVRKKPTVEGFTHDWMVFVRGPEHSNIQHFVEKVVFHLHESFPKPKRGKRSVISASCCLFVSCLSLALSLQSGWVSHVVRGGVGFKPSHQPASTMIMWALVPVADSDLWHLKKVAGNVHFLVLNARWGENVVVFGSVSRNSCLSL